MLVDFNTGIEPWIWTHQILNALRTQNLIASQETFRHIYVLHNSEVFLLIIMILWSFCLLLFFFSMMLVLFQGQVSYGSLKEENWQTKYLSVRMGLISLWFEQSNNSCQKCQESGSCSVHRTGCLSSPIQMLESCNIPRDLLVFTLYFNPY